MPTERLLGILTPLIIALLVAACASAPQTAKLSEEPIADGLHRVEVRSRGALLVPLDHAKQRAAALEAGGYAIRSCMVAFAGEHDEAALKPLQDSLNRNFCAEVKEHLKTQGGIDAREPAPGMIMLEAYLLNLDPTALTGDSNEVRFSKPMEARLYIKGTRRGRPALRYSENTSLARGDAGMSVSRAVDLGVGNLSRIFGRLGDGQPDVASP